ncbi:proton-conducting transporter membrane subunit [Alkalimonas collagenimarina]|uniref:Proton-conducting transporter membrane subunit n=1 Tax=Alkalimonas collagenimarina TaxID=400390 RepID=A0ABT9GZU5_9GAMM|nr:proton-conducting transporter membrane subunit [Alkalimonas collagenimarina]MDP4536215.1 proton-conducting transporter membrane subunit [Alkalimonas collagenimarina]
MLSNVVEWLWPGASFGLANQLAQLWFGFTLLLWLAAACYSVTFIKRQVGFYWLFFIVAMSGNLLLIVAQDVLGFYLGFALMSLSAYALVIHSGSSQARRAGRLYLQLAIVGELLLFAAIVLRVHESDGNLALAELTMDSIQPLTLLLLLLGFGLKAGFFPLHVWLPQAHPAAPAPASAVLSGAMIKAGLFGLWVFVPASAVVVQQWAVVLLVLGLCSALFGAVIALWHQQSKVVLAYSSVSQMGYMLMALAIVWLSTGDARVMAATVLVGYACHHAFLKAALFLGAGACSSYRLQRFHWLAIGWCLFTLVALPLSSGAAVKYGLKQGLMAQQSSPVWLAEWLYGLLSVGALTTALLALHLWCLLRQQQMATHSQSMPAVSGWMNSGWLILVVASISMPFAVISTQPFWWASISLSAVWASSWPVLAAVLLFLIVRQIGWILPERWRDPQSRFVWLSLRAKRLYQTQSRAEWQVRWPGWRSLERQINQGLQRAELLSTAAVVLSSVMLILWLLH